MENLARLPDIILPDIKREPIKMKDIFEGVKQAPKKGKGKKKPKPKPKPRKPKPKGGY